MAKEAEGKGTIYEKILRSLKAGESKGGDKRGKQSAAIIVVKKEEPSRPDLIDPMSIGKAVNIRVDDFLDPLSELFRIFHIWKTMFLPEEMVDIKDCIEEINAALNYLGYKSIEEWIQANNYHNKFLNNKIGLSVLKILLSNKPRNK